MQEGKLLDATLGSKPDLITNTYNGQSIMTNDRIQYFSVQLGDMIYSFEMRQSHAKKFIIGDPVQGCVNGKDFQLLSPEGKVYKARIEKRARVK